MSGLLDDRLTLMLINKKDIAQGATKGILRHSGTTTPRLQSSRKEARFMMTHNESRFVIGCSLIPSAERGEILKQARKYNSRYLP